jgi:hypothetical protein
MFAKGLKGLLLVLIAAAFLGGPAAQAMSLARAMDKMAPGTGMAMAADCEQMGMVEQTKTAGDKSEPCKSMTLDCIQKMGCFATSASLAPALQGLFVPTAKGGLRYALDSVLRAGQSLPPDPFPPKPLLS